MLSLKQLKDVCMFGVGSNQCRYLERNPLDYNRFDCHKKSTGDKKRADASVDAYISHCAKINYDPKNGHNPIGDNCSGYIILKSIEQGYDKP